MRAPIRRIGVIIPAHDEEIGIGRCLEAVCRAAEAVPVPVSVIAVLDDCRDRTEDICRTFPVEVVTIKACSVGVARHAGIASFLSGVGETESIWIANTDADSVVPSTWLLDQIRVAETGADVVVGTVRLADETGRVGRNFSAAYAAGLRSRGGHSHVHGANVGFRAGAYLEVGGFPPLAVHEDRSLLRRLEAAGAVIARSSRLRVETSGRLVGRCTGGFASSLLQLASTD